MEPNVEQNAWQPGYVSPTDGMMWDGSAWVAPPKWGSGQFADMVWKGKGWVAPSAADLAHRQATDASGVTPTVTNSEAQVVALLREQVALTRSIRAWVTFLGILGVLTLAGAALLVLGSLGSL